MTTTDKQLDQLVWAFKILYDRIKQKENVFIDSKNMMDNKQNEKWL